MKPFSHCSIFPTWVVSCKYVRTGGQSIGIRRCSTGRLVRVHSTILESCFPISIETEEFFQNVTIWIYDHQRIYCHSTYLISFFFLRSFFLFIFVFSYSFYFLTFFNFFLHRTYKFSLHFKIIIYIVMDASRI